MRVLVCGGRNHPDPDAIYNALDALGNGSVIIEGGALGADCYAAEWACFWSKEVLTFAPDWKTHGKAAGPIRNSQMIKEGKPDLVLAFRGGKGTADMVSKAKKAGIPVTEFDE